MANMQKLKEDALRRKHEHEEKQRKEELRKMKSGRPRSGKERERPSARNQRGKTDTPAPVSARRKPKKTPARWVVDILLVLGALMLLVMMFNPYG